MTNMGLTARQIGRAGARSQLKKYKRANDGTHGTTTMKHQTGLFYGWRIVATCFVIAAFAWSLGLFGSSVYLQSLTVERGWSVAAISSAITLFFLVSAAVQRVVGRSIDRWTWCVSTKQNRSRLWSSCGWQAISSTC